MSRNTENQPLPILTCPPEGQGVNHWTFLAVLSCKQAGLSKEKAREIVCNDTTRVDTSKAEAEIERALDKVYDSKSKRQKAQPKFPARNADLIKKVVNPSLTVSDLTQLSPSPIPSTASEAINGLFGGDPLLCGGKGKHQFWTLRKSKWLGHIDNKEFITPSPMTHEFGVTKDGKISAHTASNTGKRKFLVIECDPTRQEDLESTDPKKRLSPEEYLKRAKNEQAAIGLHLRQFAQIACIVFSGGKSLHTWAHVEEWSEAKQFNLFQYACGLGADPRMWLRFQFARLPGGYRDSGGHQEILYFDQNFNAERGDL
jgi:hypothetical protein